MLKSKSKVTMKVITIGKKKYKNSLVGSTIFSDIKQYS